MAYRVLEVTLLSAKDLKKVNLLTRMEVYAVATISSDPITRQCTPPDPYGGRHPSWNVTLRFSVPPTAAAARGCLHVLLRTERSLGDRDVGEVIVPLAEVLASACPRDLGPRPPQFACYQVRKVHRTETRGVLHLSYRLGPVVAPQVTQAIRADEPVVVYPVARPFHPQPYTYLPPALLPPPQPSPQASGHVSMPSLSPQASGHMAMPPPSPHASGHMAMPPPPPKAYGHLSMPPPPPLQASGQMATPPPPPPKASSHVAMPPPTPLKASGHTSMPPPASPGAGYVAVPQPPKTAGYAASLPWTAKNDGNMDFGMGVSAGLVGGAIGGMMAGDMMSDAAAYNAGYRAGLASDWGGAVY